ncbi:MAG: hypothetical protein V4479_10595 [Actinomycetota bacterium]
MSARLAPIDYQAGGGPAIDAEAARFAAAGKLQLTTIPGDDDHVVVKGTCPRCKDQFGGVYNLSYIVAGVQRVDRPLGAVVTCGCTVPHKNRPPTVAKGCGAEFEVTGG